MSRLWKVDDQATRLAELTSQDRDLKEAPLRRDVRSLGRLLGEVLKEQVGDNLFSAVEELRLLLIEHRELHAQLSALPRRSPNHGITERPRYRRCRSHDPLLCVERTIIFGHIICSRLIIARL